MRTERLMRMSTFGLATSLSVTMAGLMLLLSQTKAPPTVIFWLSTGALLLTFPLLLKGVAQGMLQTIGSHPAQGQSVSVVSNPRFRLLWFMIVVSITLGLAIWAILRLDGGETNEAIFILTMLGVSLLVVRTILPLLYPKPFVANKGTAPNAASRRSYFKFAARLFVLPFVISLCVVSAVHSWIVMHVTWYLMVAVGVVACCIPLQLAVIRSVARELGVPER